MDLNAHDAGAIPQRRELFATITRRGGDLIVHLEGPSITQREAPLILEQINQEMDDLGKRLKRLILDCSDVRLLSSYGLGACIDARNRANLLGARTYVVGLDEQLESLFKMIKVDRLIKIVHDPSKLF